MIILLSPAKTLDFESDVPTQKTSDPLFLKDTKELILILKKMSGKQLSTLMGISAKLGELNAERFKTFKLPQNPEQCRQAVLAFKGDVYEGLQAERFSESDFSFAQKQLRLLSGLYGVLRPLDLIQPYRLEMGTDLPNNAGKNLYDFWKTKVTTQIQKDLKETNSKVLLNLASNEYFSAVNSKAIEVPIISPVFKDFKNGDYKIISFFAKKARGLMAGHVLRNRIDNPADLRSFKNEGYKYDPKSSTPAKPVFLRKAS